MINCQHLFQGFVFFGIFLFTVGFFPTYASSIFFSQPVSSYVSIGFIYIYFFPFTLEVLFTLEGRFRGGGFVVGFKEFFFS